MPHRLNLHTEWRSVPATSRNKSRLTYRDAGVDIDAGNALVEAIGPLAAKTKRKGVLGGDRRLRRPVRPEGMRLQGPRSRRRDRRRRHQAEARHRDRRCTTGIGIDLVAMNVNDLVVQGAEPLFFLDYFASGKLDLGVAETVIGEHRQGLQGGRLRADRRRDRRDAGTLCARRLRPRRICRRRGRARSACSRARTSRPATSSSRCPPRACTPTASRWCAAWWSNRACAGATRRPSPASKTLGEALLTPTRIYVRQILEAIRRTGAVKALAHITGGGLTDNIPRVLPKTPRRRDRSRHLRAAAGLRLAATRGAARSSRDAAHLQLRHRHDPGRRRLQDAKRVLAPSR